MKQDLNILKKKLQHIVNATETLDFPLISTFEKKCSILHVEKNNIEEQIGNILSMEGLDVALLEIDYTELWKQADDEARSQFGHLNEKQMMNGFYLQEVMHRYVELIIKVIISKISDEGELYECS